MKHNLYVRFLILGLFLCFLGGKAYSQITITGDSVSCGATHDTLRASLIAYTPTSSGITGDDNWSGVINLGFTFNFYGSSHTQCLIGSNGAISFNTGLAGGSFGWSITAVLLGNTNVKNCVCGPWCDIFIPAGGTITYATVGTAPYRKFIANWCHTRMYSCTSQWITTQIILYETSDIAEVHIGHKTICSWNGGYAIVGVQNAAGSAATAAPSRDYPTTWTATNEAWQFTPPTSGTAYSCSSITYASVPLASSTVYWFDSSTGAYLGSGNAIDYAPASGSGTVYAIAAGCDDTTKTYYHLDLAVLGGGNSPVHITSVNSTDPTICGVCNGSIRLVGVNPHVFDTIFYAYNGVPQALIVDSASFDSTLTISGLCAGVYNYFYVKEGPCPSNVVGPITLTDPPFTISAVSHTDPTSCGACDGTITVYGLVPGFTDTLRYDLAGVPQAPVIAYVTGSGTMTITGLAAGTYSNIRVSMNYCVTPPVGPITLVNPNFAIADTSHTNASCSACDGTFTLYGLLPGRTITVNYDYNGTPQTPVTLISTSAGSVTITGLCPGIYNNFSATLGSCVAGACVSTFPGNIRVIPPPLIPIRHVTHVSASECGACNGTITISGLAPGSIDTVFFKRNGVNQTPVVYSAAPDSSITIYGLCAGNYTDFFIKQGPCPTTTLTATIPLVDPPIIPGFTQTIRLGCTADTVIFTNTSTSPGFLWYVWHFGDGTTDTTANPIHLYHQGSPAITLLVTNHHCLDSFTRSLALDHPIKSVFTASPIVCQNTPVTLTNSSIGTPPTYKWTFGDGASDVAAVPGHSYAHPGRYKIRLIATNLVPCSDTSYADVVVDSQTIMSLKVSDTNICRGAYITLNSTYTDLGNTGIVWEFGNGDSVKNVNPVVYSYYSIGTFTVKGTAKYRVCQDVSVYKNITVRPVPTIDLGPDTTICDGNGLITILDHINHGNTAARWKWSTGETGSSIHVGGAGYYSATVTLNHCEATDSVWIKSDCHLHLPNVFSPNGDGVNDYFCPRDMWNSGLSTFKMAIYNRWGVVIFESNAIEGRGWDGKLNDVPQPEGVYVYVIDVTFLDGKKEHHQGNLTLLR